MRQTGLEEAAERTGRRGGMTELKHKMTELKPCPFCGEPAEINVNPNTLHAVALCKKCNVTMKKSYKGNRKIEETLIELIAWD